MKKILQVVSCLELGGTESFIMNNYRAINRDQYQFDFLVFIEKDYPYLDEIHELGGNVFFACVPSFFNVRTFLLALKKIISENGPYDAIHSHVNIANAFVLFGGLLCGIKTRVSHSHAIIEKDSNFIKRQYRLIQRVLINCFATAKIACSSEAGISLYGKSFSKYGKVIPNGIELDRFLNFDPNHVERLRQEFSVPSECDFVVGNISRFDRNKNQKFLIDVFFQILHKKPDAILLIGGPDGGELGAIKRRVEELNISDNVRFIGKRTDIADCLQLIDVYLFPSLSEGLGIALIEAQAAGCLCFASKTIPQKVDVGLGTLYFLDLQDSAHIWACDIVKKFEKFSRPSKDKIESMFHSKEYDSLSSLKYLLEIYDGK